MRNSLSLLDKSKRRLFRDALKEVNDQPKHLSPTNHSEDAWDGDEHPHHTTLRMLIDSRKPLRDGRKDHYGDSKLKTVQQPLSPTDNLIPSDPNFMPWDAEFVQPSHASRSKQPSIYRARNLQSQARQKLQSLNPDSKTKALIRDTKKSKDRQRRLVNARDGAIDYSLTGSLDDIQNNEHQQSQFRPRPQSLEGWQSLVEVQIQRAQRQGQFNNLPGKGEPLGSVSEGNPFIDREEFLMNRLISRQGAVPAFVELQMLMEGEVTSLRNYLREEYTKRWRYTGRITANDCKSDHAPTHTPTYVPRDRDWEQRQQSYHMILLDRVNGAIKSYNAIAPPSTRRGLLLLDSELQRAREAAVTPSPHHHHHHTPPEQSPRRPHGKASALMGKLREIFGGL
ncbi:hypothetical protein E3P92_01443 [Wallemia ichthyophaga]|uniref:DnaJ homologue subfamily C member 28 conserved domain-containing protein n=2 Tax=Wallemia ichthyophaga TaxID=245174 RepID=A0A4T0HFL3_WALIC|nr:uncharacterized protein J056_000867 [Wallemia ichthyophaga EXF-994]TIA74030.1 hypothetical protein E3P91_01162 [Wallemia ichthyophaga]EOR00329.1 hypothetical protein J056_000867 [Wallemia ichthyophaga EXF-994]TIA82627.1 hypothetical protein E3P98_01302 [Wallemia ichthyophaga]TIB01491.1 hypothetical protein E3P95_01304 [Wallemia ichthyophaga]TIB02439.1 hypothetical protein E3P94_01436 [Wallemia ichthyophaga]